MNKRQIIILGIIFALLLFTSIIKKIITKPKIEEEEYLPLNISLEAEKVYKIVIRKPKSKTLILKRKDKDWIVFLDWQTQANKKKIERLIKEISLLKGELRSRSKEVFPDYGISDEEAIQLSFFDKEEKKIEEILVGIKKLAWNKCFVRKRDSSSVYLVEKNIFGLLGIYGSPQESELKIDNWVERKILNFEVDKIDSIKVVKKEKNKSFATLTLKRVEEKKRKRWITEEEIPFGLDAGKIKNHLKRLKNLYALRVIEPDKEYGFDDPYLVLTLEEEGKIIKLLVADYANKEREERYIKNPKGYLFIISKYTLKEIDVDVSKFFVNNPLKIDEKKINRLIVKTLRKKVELEKEKIKKNKDYLEKLKKFRVEKLAKNKRLKIPTPYYLEITYTDKSPLTLYVRKEDGNWFAKLKDYPQVFIINQDTFKNIFEDVNKIK